MGLVPNREEGSSQRSGARGLLEEVMFPKDAEELARSTKVSPLGAIKDRPEAFPNDSPPGT